MPPELRGARASSGDELPPKCAVIEVHVPELKRLFNAIDPSPFRDTNVRRNEDVGPFTVSVARDVSRLMGDPGKQLKWLQAERCKTKLAAYLEENGLADAGYCGEKLLQHQLLLSMSIVIMTIDRDCFII